MSGLLLVVAALAVLLGLWRWIGPAPAGGSSDVSPEAGLEARDAPSVDGHAPRDPRHGRGKVPTGGSDDARQDRACTARARRVCAEGDVYWADNCGGLGGKHAECGQRLCEDGACLGGDDSTCAGLPLEGLCEGDVARGCIGGQAYARDCALLDMRCVVGDEGAECRAQREDDCDNHGELPRCEGPRLLSCVDGALRVRDCGAFGGSCGPLPGGGHDVCRWTQRLPSAPEVDDPCGACGCEDEDDVDSHADSLAGLERCDGEDNDADGEIDEGAQCDPLDMVAFIVTDGAGQSSYADADIEREVERINRTFGLGGEHAGITVRLAEIVRLARPAWLQVDSDELDTIVRDPDVAAPRERVFVPVVFTDRLESGGTPKAGVATLPNGRCGGRRVSDHPVPALGGVVVSKGRSPTTTAHEIGHFLGLCHTHFGFGDEPVRVVSYPGRDGAEVEEACDAPCIVDGDGICDTPPDPGPEACRYDSSCQVSCEQGERPDAFNVMSYYTSCRHALSPLQLKEMRHGLRLRRGWQPCLGAGACACQPGDGTCPEQMTCRPATDGAFECGLDGPLLPGEACRRHAECGGGALCAQGVCRRACSMDGADGPSREGREGGQDCRCVADPVLGVSLCS